jgi:hypothetical protein
MRSLESQRWCRRGLRRSGGCTLIRRWWRGGWGVGSSAVQLGASLRLAAYVFQREAVKARRVRGGGVRAAEGQAAPL